MCVYQCPVTGVDVVAELMELAETRQSLRNCTFELHHEKYGKVWLAVYLINKCG